MLPKLKWIAVLLGASAASAGGAQQWHPPVNPQVTADEEARVRNFVARFDPAAFHYPREVSSGGRLRPVRQPPNHLCTTDPEIDRLVNYRNARFLSEQDRMVIGVALESSRTCRGTFSGASNPFGRVPQGQSLTSLRSVIGRGTQVVDYRLASPEQRAACTRAISRPLPRFVADYTYIRSYTVTAFVMYDIGTDGLAHNVAMLSLGPDRQRNVPLNVSVGAREAAAASRFEPPMLNGKPLHCINVTERMSKVGDGDGGFRSYREFYPIIGQREW